MTPKYETLPLLIVFVVYNQQITLKGAVWSFQSFEEGEKSQR